MAGAGGELNRRGSGTRPPVRLVTLPMERDHHAFGSDDRSERDRRDAELCADLRERIAHARELTRRSRDLLSAVSAEPRSFRREAD